MRLICILYIYILVIPKKKHTHTTLYHIKFSYNNQLEKKKKKSLITVNHEIFKHGYKLKLVVTFNEKEAFRTH